ncbi:MAG: PilC/PilY family type IV pilus protein, partial [Pseudomonadota bacterium]
IIDASNNTTTTVPPGLGTGKEIFAFMPQELLANQNTYYQNTLGQHPYGVDGAISFWVNDVANDNTITIGTDHVYAYFGLRRGGKSYYALDVTGCGANPCTVDPTIKWKITNNNGNGVLYSATSGVGTISDQFKELSQSWSKMEPIKIKINSVIKNVLIFGGGYDPSNDTSATRATDSTGRAIYIIDAETGERLWEAGSSALSADSGLSLDLADMKYSIPADVQVIDVIGDGLANQFYVGDMGGQIWRFDVNNEASSWSGAITGGVIADLAESGVGTEANNRRFFYPVDVALTSIDKKDVLTLAIGSGWRSHPLDSIVNDNLYVLKTTDVYSPPKNSGGVIEYVKKVVADLHDVTEPGDVPDGIKDDGASAAEYAAELLLKEKMDFTGWYIQMETAGEKIISSSTTFNDHILFSSYIPTAAGNVCQAAQGSGRLYIVDLLTGKAKLDLNNNDEYEAKIDRYVQLSHGGIPPSPSILIPPGDSPPIVLVGTENPLKRKHLEGDTPGGGGLSPAKGVSSTYWREAGEYWETTGDTDGNNLKDQ